MRVRDGHNISDVRAYGKVIITIRKGMLLIWEAVKSCFGKGYWINEKPWRNDNGWKN